MKRKRWPWVALVAVGVILAALFALDRFLRPYDLATERAAARAAGIPFTEAELHRPKPATGQDAAPEWQALTKELEKKPLDEASMKAADAVLKTGGRPTNSEAAALRRLLESRPDVLERVHAIAGKESAYFPQTWLFTDEHPYYKTMRVGAKLLRAESMLMARNGQYAEAARNQALGFRIADHAATDPLMIGYLVATSITAITLDGMADILSMSGPDARAAGAVRNAVEHHSVRLDPVYALKGEALYGITTLRSLHSPAGIRALSEPSPSVDQAADSSKPGPLFRRYYLDAGEAVYLHWMARIVRGAAEPPSRRLAAMEAIQAQAESELKTFRPANQFATMLIPVFSKSVIRGDQQQARREALLAATHALDYRAAHRRWPTRLGGAMTKPPVDPLTGAPMEYRVEGQGFTISSAGPVAAAGAEESSGLVFRYPGGFQR